MEIHYFSSSIYIPHHHYSTVILSLASKTLSPLLFCYAEFYGRGEGSSNSCNIPCAAAHYRKPQCGLACGRYVNSHVMTSVMNIIITQRSTLYCVTPLYRIASRYITNEQQEFLRRALIGQFKPQLRNHGISKELLDPSPRP